MYGFFGGILSSESATHLSPAWEARGRVIPRTIKQPRTHGESNFHAARIRERTQQGGGSDLWTVKVGERMGSLISAEAKSGELAQSE